MPFARLTGSGLSAWSSWARALPKTRTRSQTLHLQVNGSHAVADILDFICQKIEGLSQPDPHGRGIMPRSWFHSDGRGGRLSDS